MVSRKSNAQAEVDLLAHFFQVVIDHAFCASETEFSRDNVTQISYVSSPKQESLYFPPNGDLLLMENFDPKMKLRYHFPKIPGSMTISGIVRIEKRVLMQISPTA